MRYIAFLTLMTLFGWSAQAQDYAAISDAFSDGNATALGRLMDATVEMDMEGSSSKVGRSDAENKLRTFFMDHEPRHFEVVHKGVSPSDVHYCIGQLSSSGGAYRVTLYLRKSMDQYLIQSLEIEQE